jgi:hypothetical protein
LGDGWLVTLQVLRALEVWNGLNGLEVRSRAQALFEVRRVVEVHSRA